MIESRQRRAERIKLLIIDNPGIGCTEIMGKLRVSADQVYRAIRNVKDTPGFLFHQMYHRRSRYYTQAYARANDIKPVVSGPLKGHDYKKKKKKKVAKKMAFSKSPQPFKWVPGRLAMEMSE